MANWSDPRTTFRNPGAEDARGIAADAGLRSYMLKVYNYMMSGVLLTGIVAMLFVNSPAFQPVMTSGLRYVFLLAPLALVMALSFGINRMQASTAQALFWAYAAINGIALSPVIAFYTHVSIAETFFATAAAFGGLSLFGYTTKRDLSPIGTFLIMGVFGLVIAMIINMFMHSGPMALMIDVIGILIFAGLTAYDTQKIKSMYFHVAGNGEAMAKTAVMGALQLYLDFLNMFLFLLRLMGDRR
ncbi:MAG: Bax inhibitor-1/YccA family protein [Alphaproteobacteria bacterium]|nr:Bax inhibitor-1/YccA family protein [Alphaproteobacteria bacterium]MDE2339958.1 Bax inhibitor-1/YccA family protein [Alphaproteobacteria bacterium]